MNQTLKPNIFALDKLLSLAQVMGLEGFVGLEAATTGFAPDPETMQKRYESGYPKQERSGNNEDQWRSSKLAKFEDFSASKATSNNTELFCSQIRSSFSGSKCRIPLLYLTSPAYTRNTGYSSGGFNGTNMHGVLTGARGPFTPSQWMELEHQALIYKYITSNAPIPSDLPIPIRKSHSASFSIFSGGLLRPNTLGWGAFHLGFSNNTDPEPGRCRRTDGKKWRCSRDAVADQKYCERHMNRGRHRSRKPVEGQSGHSAAATTTKLMPNVSSSPTSVSGRANQWQRRVQQPLHRTTAVQELAAWLLPSKDTAPGLAVKSLTCDLKSKENSSLIPKQPISYEQNSRAEFGVVSSDSLLNPSHKGFSLIKCRNFGSSLDASNQETETQHSLRQFMDEWPKTQSDRSAISWPEVDVQSDGTQLTISVPMAATDFISFTSSTNNNEKVTLSPLRLSREFYPIHMGLGVGNESNQRQANWIPISWESSMGGPLGEVLHSTNNSTGECKNTSPLGVLQKTTFASLSTSSTGSSTRAENNKANESANLRNNLLGSTLVHPSSLPAL
ncbi:Growth-regulating factor 8 [Hibiscus syriacus]|uniref:Growth-regulating factor n=1 Tax=Hibiscus syriacus TaxID=106335 RepID=A0A6A2WET6_HIBSY|nr:Growth-regulating factor 8 [Hibiscus syriacus]